MMLEFDLVIAGRVVTPNGIIDNGWIAVAGDTIAALGSGEAPAARRMLEASGQFVLPGVIDGQTHAGSQFGFAGLTQTTMSAIAGGVTTIVDMPYDQPNPVTTLDLLHAKAEAVESGAYCDVALYGTIPAEPDVAEIRQLVAAGACAFKISSFENHPTRFPRIDNGAALLLLQTLADTDVPVGLHNEDQEIVRRTTAAFKAAGRTGPEHHSPSRPESAELLATANFLQLGALTGAHVHIVHLSTASGFLLVENFRQRGTRATGEMCVHYLHFDGSADINRLGGILKVNPPIRNGQREALWSILDKPVCEFVSSDHSAWPLASKQAESIFDVAAGIPGLETLLPVFFSDCASRKGADLAAQTTARLLSERPARFFGLERKGCIAPGMDADLVILEQAEWRFSSAEAHDGLGWSAYEGETFMVRPKNTFVRGHEVWNGEVVGRPGFGKFVPRTRR